MSDVEDQGIDEEAMSSIEPLVAEAKNRLTDFFTCHGRRQLLWAIQGAVVFFVLLMTIGGMPDALAPYERVDQQLVVRVVHQSANLTATAVAGLSQHSREGLLATND